MSVQAQTAINHDFSGPLHEWDRLDVSHAPSTTANSSDESHYINNYSLPISSQLMLTYNATSRWRPKFHIMAAHGWMNDPCAPGYDSIPARYHVNFQWNPHGSVWGNMSWGSATSPNMVDWTISRKPSMVPTAAHDQCGVFTGALQPRNGSTATSAAQRDLTAFYTSARKFPINHRLPYTRGSEKLAVATSTDSGKTWKREPQNIILEEPPIGYDVVSWRDPYIGTWKSLDQLSDPGNSQSGLYGILSGGLRGQTPTAFVYRIDASSNTWTFLSSLVNIGLNYSPSRWTGGDFGTNWEVTNFITLTGDDGKTHDVLLTSVEGLLEDTSGGELSKDHRQMWMSGPLRQSGDGIQMLFESGGALDHGCFYAANGFWDPLTGNFVTYGWIFEEDLPAGLVSNQGWSGCLSIPRVANLKTWKSVVGTTRSQPTDLTSFNSTMEADGTYTMQTVSMTPDTRLHESRVNNLSARHLIRNSICAFASPRAQLEISLSFQVHDSAQHVGFDILHSADHSQYTRVYFDPPSETLIVDRSQSTTISGINVSLKKAPHTLFEFQHGGKARREDLEFGVIFDTSVLEIFVNERVAITTRVYPEEGSCYGIRLYIDDERQASGVVRDADGNDTMESPKTSRLSRHDIWELAGVVKYVN